MTKRGGRSPGVRSPAALIGCLVALLSLLAACATGSTSSIARSPA
ncbi:hypothetical protein [Candidatus Frankia alpina]|nr:hypothetical protein [Candidatus Frankia alpina]